jgi:hypothetical protein
MRMALSGRLDLLMSVAGGKVGRAAQQRMCVKISHFEWRLTFSPLPGNFELVMQIWFVPFANS